MPIAAARLLAKRLDAEDELAGFRDEFVTSDPGLVYLDGNSLGMLPRRTKERLASLVEHEWGSTLIGGWNAGWWQLPERVGDKIGRLIGADPGEVLLADSTSVNLFKLLLGFLSARPGPQRIVLDSENFPTDCYVAEGVAKLLGGRATIERIDLSGEHEDGVPPTLARAIRTGPDVVLLSHVAFRSGFCHDLAAINALAAAHGTTVIWDFSHSAGAVPIEVHGEGVRLAVGCTYKYLNGGPGAPAYLYIDKELLPGMENPVPGWFGQRDPFAMSMSYEGERTIRRFLSGSTPILSMAAVECGVDLMLEAGMDRLRGKSLRQLEFFAGLVCEFLAPLGFTIVTPLGRCGSHVSLAHERARELTAQLVAGNVIPDFRTPNLIRFGLAPITTRYVDLVTAVERLASLCTLPKPPAVAKLPTGVVT